VRRPTAGRGALTVLPPRREARLGVAGISAVEIAGEAPRLLACLLVARVLRLVDMVVKARTRGDGKGTMGVGLT
jgi:hypothetical protein